jgi:DNA-binding NtrC family response regulator
MTVLDDLQKSQTSKGETLLVIDDETSFVDVTKILLEIAGYKILTANDGLEGISAFKENIDIIDVVICDLHMPKLGGHMAVQSFLSLKPEIKILIISGSIVEEDIPRYLEPGKIEFLHKPFLTDTLLEKIRSMLH